MRQLPADIASIIPTKPYLKYGFRYVDILRNFLFKIAFKGSSDDFKIRSFTFFYFPENFTIGKNSRIGKKSRIH
jgi:hypothetical protein